MIFQTNGRYERITCRICGETKPQDFFTLAGQLDRVCEDCDRRVKERIRANINTSFRETLGELSHLAGGITLILMWVIALAVIAMYGGH